MKATGIVRRIDDLGRVVIPKEIRRTMKIREGEPLEIYTDAGGSVIFKKYSPTGEMNVLAADLCEAIYKITAKSMAVCDRDGVVAASGNFKKDLDSKPISRELEAIMQTRQTQKCSPPVDISPAVPGASADMVIPIIVGGDLNGCVIAISGDSPSSELDAKFAQTAATFFAKQLED